MGALAKYFNLTINELIECSIESHFTYAENYLAHIEQLKKINRDGRE